MTPISGAPRTTIVRIASAASSQLAQGAGGEAVRQQGLVDHPDPSEARPSGSSQIVRQGLPSMFMVR